MTNLPHLIQQIALFAIPVVFAITFHEAAHGYAAKHFGDDTAESEGRISLNPLRHVDPVGTVALPLGIILFGLISGVAMPLFGWAKPVPVNFRNLRSPKRDMLWVAAAGPAANLLMALGWGALIVFAIYLPLPALKVSAVDMALMGIQINVMLIALNLIPLPPLDGGRIAVSLLPMALARRFAKIEPYGLVILMLLLFAPSALNLPPLLSHFITSFARLITNFVLAFLGLG